MLPQKDNQRDNGQDYRSEVQTKISGAIHIGVEILPCLVCCWLDEVRNCLENLHFHNVRF